VVSPRRRRLSRVAGSRRRWPRRLRGGTRRGARDVGRLQFEGHPWYKAARFPAIAVPCWCFRRDPGLAIACNGIARWRATNS